MHPFTTGPVQGSWLLLMILGLPVMSLPSQEPSLSPWDLLIFRRQGLNPSKPKKPVAPPPKAKPEWPKQKTMPNFQQPEEPKLLFRGDKRPPEAIQKAKGFSPRSSTETTEDGYSLFKHITDKPQNTRYVSTTMDPAVAYNFGTPTGFIYVISPDAKMIDAGKSLGRHLPDRFEKEFEQASVGTIPFEQVRGWYKKSDIKRSDLLRMREGSTIDQAFKKNEQFDTKFETAKSGGARPELVGFPPESPAWEEDPWRRFKGQKVSDLVNAYVQDTICGGQADCFEQYWNPRTSEPSVGGSQQDPENSEEPGGPGETEEVPGEADNSQPNPQEPDGGSNPEPEDAGPKDNKGLGGGKGANEIPGQSKGPVQGPCQETPLKRSIGCDATEKAKLSEAKDLEDQFGKFGPEGLAEFENKKLVEAESKGLVKAEAVGLAKDSSKLAAKLAPGKVGLLSMGLLQALDKDSPPFWKALTDGLNNGTFSVIDCQMGFKKAVSKTIDHRYTEFDSPAHALMSIINMGLDIYDSIDIKIPVNFWMDVAQELPKECEEVAKAPTPEEKLKVSNEGIDVLVQAWSKYTPVGIENDRWAERNAANTSVSLGDSLLKTAYDTWSMTPVGWAITKAFPDLDKKIRDG